MCDEQRLCRERERPRTVLYVRPVHQVGVVADLEAVFPIACVLHQSHRRLGVVGAERGTLPDRDCEHLPFPLVDVAAGTIAISRQYHCLGDSLAVRIRLTLLRDEEHGTRLVGVGQVTVRVMDHARGGVEHECLDRAGLPREFQQRSSCLDVDAHVESEVVQKHAWRDQVEYNRRPHFLHDFSQSFRVADVALVVVRWCDETIVVCSVGTDVLVVDVHVFGSCYAAFCYDVVDDVVSDEATALGRG